MISENMQMLNFQDLGELKEIAQAIDCKHFVDHNQNINDMFPTLEAVDRIRYEDLRPTNEIENQIRIDKTIKEFIKKASG